MYRVIVIGGGHAGAEAAWSAANLLGEPGCVALVTLDPSKIGVMSCNPAIGGLAKGQLVREVDALGGLMGLAADAAGIMFKVLNTSRGSAVHGPRCQCDKHAYALAVQHLIASRHEIDIVAGSVQDITVERGRVTGVVARTAGGGVVMLQADAVVLTTGTFMRGLMHTGDTRTPGGRYGESPAGAISDALRVLGFELGRLKTGTPPRLDKDSIDWDALPEQLGDQRPTPFSELTGSGNRDSAIGKREEGRGDQESGFGNREGGGIDVHRVLAAAPPLRVLDTFPMLAQVGCRITRTTPGVHELIRANLHRAPMYSGRIESVGPRYCPSIEDKVVRFEERDSHHVFLEPEGVGGNDGNWIYCNGISTSLPTDVQDQLVRMMPGCERARILRYGYAVEYDMVRPHQIHATGMTRLVDGLFLAGQINGTSGYEEAAAQGLVAGVNAVRFIRGQGGWVPGRDEAYIGVMMDDLVTRTPTEPYRMFTSRAEHRLLLRADNAPDRLTPAAIELGLLDATDLGLLRRDLFASRQQQMDRVRRLIGSARVDGHALGDLIRRPEFAIEDAMAVVGSDGFWPGVWKTVWSELRYEAYIARQRIEIRRQGEFEHRRIPADMPWESLTGFRAEARAALERYRPDTFGQASRLEGVTPADLTLLAVLVKRRGGITTE